MTEKTKATSESSRAAAKVLEPDESHVGRVLGNRYEVIRLVGEGGMGKVFLADDLLAGDKRVAVKLVHRASDTATDEEQRKNLEEEEAKTMAILLNEFHSMTSLSHPNVAQAFDFGVDQETNDAYFTTEFVDGTHILRVARKLQLDREKDLEIFLHLIVQLSRGLGFVHSRGLVHADIKPENILVSGFRPGLTDATEVRVKLIDFGLMKREKAFGGKKIVGTTYYIAPETIRRARVDRRADLYSLGVVIYHLATGRLPFKGKSNLVVFKGHLEGEAIPAHERNPAVPKELSHAIARLMEKNPSDRYQNAFELIHDLNQRMGLSFPLEDRETRESYLGCVRRGGRETELTRLRSLFVSASNAKDLGFDVGEQLSDLSDIEIAQVRDLEPTTVPTGRCVILRGEKGLGKRHLLQRLAHQAQTRGAFHVDIDCRKSRSQKHGAFDRIVDMLWRLEGPANTRNAPEYLLEAEELRKQAIGTSKRFRKGAVEKGTLAVARGLASVSQRSSLLVCLQHVHLGDELMIGVMDQLVEVLSSGKFPDAHILVVCTALDYGDTEGSLFEELYASSLFRRSILELKVERLQREDAMRLVRSTFDPCDFSEPFLEKIFTESDGNPEILADIFESLLGKRRVRRTGSGWTVFGDIDG